MNDDFLTDHPDLEKLFEKLHLDPASLVFAPLADACRKAGRLKEALEICSEGVAQHSEYASGHVVLGKCYFDNQEKDKATESFNTVLSLDENNLVALKFLGMIQVENGDETAAREYFRHILALDPENTEIRAKLAHLQADRDDPGAPVVTIDPSDLIDLDAIPDEEFEGKTISLGEASETSDEFATLTLADIYASQGYTDKAIKIYREVLKDRPGNAQAREKLAALELEEGSDSPADYDQVDLQPISPAEPPDMEMENLSDTAGSRAPGSPADKRADEPSPAAASKTADPAAAEPTDEPDDAIEEPTSRRHFQNWIRRMHD